MSHLNLKGPSLTTICAILAVFGAGALQIAVALATIPNEGVMLAFCIAIGAAIIMDALVIHSIGTVPSNNKQKGIAIAMLVALFVGLALDVVLLLTHDAFNDSTFGWMRALIGVNIALSLVLAAAFFAFSDTNTHERQIKQLKHNAKMQQAKAYLNSPQATELYKAQVTAEILDETATELGIPVHQLTQYLDMTSVATGAPAELAARTPVLPSVETEKNGNHQRENFH